MDVFSFAPLEKAFTPTSVLFGFFIACYFFAPTALSGFHWLGLIRKPSGTYKLVSILLYIADMYLAQMCLFGLLASQAFKNMGNPI